MHNPARGTVIARTPLSTVARRRRWPSPPRPTPSPAGARRRRSCARGRCSASRRCSRSTSRSSPGWSRPSTARRWTSRAAACGAASSAWRWPAAAPSMLMGYGLENVAPGIDCTVMRQPIGVCAAIAPFNFPGDGAALVPALRGRRAATRSCSSRPSRCRSRRRACSSCSQQCDLPPGVVNLVHGGREVVEAICDHPGIRAVSFVGSTPVARLVYQRATHAGKRVQALGGAKNFVIVMPDADLDRSIPIDRRVVLRLRRRAVPGRQRARAGGRGARAGARPADRGGRGAEGRRRARARRRHGPGHQRAASRSACSSYVERGVSEGATLALDGRDDARGRPARRLLRRPVGVRRGAARRWRSAARRSSARSRRSARSRTSTRRSALMDAHPNANATSIFTIERQGRARVQRIARRRRWSASTSASPRRWRTFPFGGARDSFFGDLKVHGRDAFEFYTDKKVTISRWF